MADLKTKYMGISLKNPIIAGASNMTANLDKIKRLEDAGVAAIVTKSLFEEQVQLERYKLDEDLHKYDDIHAEMVTIYPEIEHAGPEEHLMWVRKTVESVDIPVIASLNAVNKEIWVDYAKQLAETGAQGLELNFYATPSDFDQKSDNIEKEQLSILKEVKKVVPIPISVKLSPFYTNPLQFIANADRIDVQAFVIFNRMFQPEINVEKQTMRFPFNLSEQNDNRLPLRFAGLLHGNINAQLCASTGIFDGSDVIKMQLAGADCVQVVSTLYRNKSDQIAKMLDFIANWMDENGCASLDDYKGKLSRKNSTDPWIYKRAQYVNMLFRGKIA
ncbi:MAG: dihydroorotate dehydrogenase-like protein [candidate division KSB1 bacterium]|jgi:dihydroorotate dehydrogenase (fumarate)|nr:dihydroorotate dehydrogenase-like protein [candidate division KSB1 bacterium]